MSLTLPDVIRWIERHFFSKGIHRGASSGAVHGLLPVVLDAAGKLDDSFTADVLTPATSIATPIVKAAGAAGLRLEDDGGNLGILVEDGGNLVDIASATHVEPYTGFDAQGNVMVIVRYATAHSTVAPIVGAVFANNQTDATDGNVAHLTVMNEAIAAAEKRLAQILFLTNAAIDEGQIRLRVFAGGVANDALTVRASGRVGLQTVTPLGELHVEQTSTTAGIPVLVLDQKDLSEEFIEFDTTTGTNNPIEAVGAKTLTTTHFVRISINGSFRYIPVGTIA